MQERTEPIKVFPRCLVQAEMLAGQVELEKVDNGPADTIQANIHFQASFQNHTACSLADELQVNLLG